MAFVRFRDYKGGRYYYVIDSGHERAAGRGSKGKKVALRWSEKINEIRLRRKAGLPDEEIPSRSTWTLSILRDRDLEDARGRGLLSLRKRESHWRIILEYFSPDLPLDEITPATIADFVRWRRARGAGPATINRDLRSCLRPALALARRLRSESGYAGDPFRDLPQLEERRARRAPIALPPKDVERLLALFWKRDRKIAAAVEILLLTASRIGERYTVEKGFVCYPAHKRGIARRFPLKGRLAELVHKPQAWSRRTWKRVVAEFGRPDLRPHDLRHTAITRAFHSGVGWKEIQKLGGWKSLQMPLRTYSHLFPEPSKTVSYGAAVGRKR
jgi:integrase